MATDMTETIQSFSAAFPAAEETDWLRDVEKALKGGGLDRITRKTADGIGIQPLYRETDFASREDPRGAPGQAPFLRGPLPDPHLPWDIRQSFSHPDPVTTNAEILRDLERGVSAVELRMDESGQQGVQITCAKDLDLALASVRADIAPVALDHRGAGPGLRGAALLALWGEQQENPKAQRFSFNIDPVGALMRTGKIPGGVTDTMAHTAALTEILALRFPLSTALRVDARPVHEAGGTEAQELGALMAHALETMRYLSQHGLPLERLASQLLFTVSLDANYGMGIAKLRAARRLWARLRDGLGLDAEPMRLQAVSSRRMLTGDDPWVNMLRGTAACFAGAVGGADMIGIEAFNSTFAPPEELGRRVARNTQIIAMEESGLGRVADPSGGAWFTERLSEDLAHAAWAAFQKIEAEGGIIESLVSGAFQSRIVLARGELEKKVATRKTPLTGVSEFPSLETFNAPAADLPPLKPGLDISVEALTTLLPSFRISQNIMPQAVPLKAQRLSEPYEALRQRADRATRKQGHKPSIFIATLGPLSEHTARLDFARNAFAAGGIIAIEAQAGDRASLVSGFREAPCRIAVICGADPRYEDEAEALATMLKSAGARRIWIAGRFTSDSVDRQIFQGCDLLQELELALTDAECL